MLPLWAWVTLAVVAAYAGYRHATWLRAYAECRLEGHRWGVIESGLKCVRCGVGPR